MAWKAMDVQDQRVRFVVAASRGEKSLSALCVEFGISRPTGALWTRRYAEAGLAGIAERSRRPRHSPGQTAWESEEQVIALRLKYPDWGARKLEVLLRRQGVDLTRSTIHRILLRYDLVRDQDRHAPAVKRFKREQPNELWQMDFKGPKNWPHASVALDDAAGHPAVLVRHPQTQGKVERFHGSLQRALDRRGGVGAEPQPWLDRFRSEYNQVRTHEALAMRTPGQRLATEFTALQPQSATVAVSRGCLGAQGGLPG